MATFKEIKSSPITFFISTAAKMVYMGNKNPSYNMS